MTSRLDATVCTLQMYPVGYLLQTGTRAFSNMFPAPVAGDLLPQAHIPG